MILKETEAEPARTLVVFVPPAGVKESRWDEPIGKLKASLDSDGFEWLIYSPDIRRSITEAAVDLRARIDQQCMIGGTYERIVLIGVSLGGFIVRLSYLQSLGLYLDSPLTFGWARLVVRIVLVASPSRGIGLDAWGAIVRGLMRPALALSLSLSTATRYMRDLLTGSDLITDLKIRWVRHFCEPGSVRPLVVQVLPAPSGSVLRSSMVDRVQFPGSRYIDVPGVNQNEMQDPERYLVNPALFGLIRSAIFGELAEEPVTKSSVVDRVVFVLHGIRASNTGWVSQVSGLLKERAPTAEVVVASYGYYSLLRFPFALLRRRNVRWFQDLYSYNCARYPQASFYFIGHSYGTYILGQSLLRLPAMRFERVVLIGSVLPREYGWSDRLDAGQVVEIRNDRSTSDIPVKVLCSALHAFGGDVGTAGVDGFDDGRCREVYFYKGNHSRPLDGGNLSRLVDYLLTGQYTPPPDLVGEISSRLGFLARVAPAMAIVSVFVLISVLLGVGWLSINYGWTAGIIAGLVIVVAVVLLDAL